MSYWLYKDAATGKCRKKGTKKVAKKAKATRKVAKKPKTANKTKKSPNSLPLRVTLPLGRKRCPKGYKKLLGDGVTKIICEKSKYDITFYLTILYHEN